MVASWTFAFRATHFFKPSSATVTNQTRVGSYFANFFSNTPQATLQKSKAKILRYIKIFHQAAELIHREEIRRHHLEVTKRLGNNFTSLPRQFLDVMELSEVDFPVTTVSMYRNLIRGAFDAIY